MSFVERQKQLLLTGEFADFNLDVDGRKFKVHRNIICPRSTVLHRICAGNFKEAVESSGSLPEADAAIFERVLEFIYTGEYDLGMDEPESVPHGHIDMSGSRDSLGLKEGDDLAPKGQHSEELMVHTEVYLLAKYLDISELVKHAADQFIAAVKKRFRTDTLVEPFARVFNHGEDGGDGLRAQIVRLCLENLEDVLQNGELTRLLLEHEPVAWRLLLWQYENYARRIDETTKAQQILEEKVETSEGTIQCLRGREKELTEVIDRMLASFGKHDKCRNCYKEFGSYADKDERGIIRCKTCRCRHYL